MRFVTIPITIVAFLALACGGGGGDGDPLPTSSASPAVEPTSTPEESPFPVVLAGDTLVVASADGSEITERSLEPGDRPVFRPSSISPGGERTVTLEDGTLFLRERDGEPVAIADVASTAEFVNVSWSPDGASLMFDTEGSSSSIYVVDVDGSGLTDVGAGLEGDAFPLSWSLDSERVAFGLVPPAEASTQQTSLYVTRTDGTDRTLAGEFFQPQGDQGWDLPAWSPDGSKVAVLFAPAGGIGVLDTAGGPAIDIVAGEARNRFSWSPDSQALAFDGQLPGDDGGSIVLVDIASPDEPRMLTEGHWPRWSPAGDRIAFKRQGSVFTVRADGTEEALLGSEGPAFFGELTWTAAGESVEFVRAAPSAQYLYAVELSTGDLVRSPSPLIDFPFAGPRQYVRLSPDGDQVVFSVQSHEVPKEGQETGDIIGAGWFIMNVATGEVTQVASDPSDGDVFWSPDGLRIVFSGGADGVFVAEGDFTQPRKISAIEAHALAWSPDGQSLAVGSQEAVWIVPAEGGAARLIATLTTGTLQRIDWSPDGGRLLYEVSRQDDARVTEVFVVNVDGPSPALLVSTPEGVAGARWSPDGEVIAFQRNEGPVTEVWLIDVDGSNERRLATFEGEHFGLPQLSWSPDATSLALVHGQNDVWVISIPSGEKLLAATNVGNCSMSLVGWSPDSEMIYAVPACALSPI